MLREQLRRNLLKDMGITSWFPRVPLPGAALSHDQCVQAFLQHPAQAADPASAPASAPAVLAELLASDAVSPQAAMAQPVMPEPAVASAAAQQAAIAEPFGFSWFAVDSRLSVLAMLPPGQVQLSPACRQMLARMLAALYAPWQSLTLVDQNFHWPIDEALPGDAVAARQAVEGFIARRLREQGAAQLLVLCEGLPEFLAATAQAPAARGFSCHVTHSLHAMEHNAGLKREAWQSLQGLRELLNR